MAEGPCAPCCWGAGEAIQWVMTVTTGSLPRSIPASSALSWGLEGPEGGGGQPPAHGRGRGEGLG
eukprot:CAMPEP_0174350656 /NCGR_PEP_ID=MMETSP0811_2-20130205/7784_1 /TAXON_ID=73025 ORGANISM="Eutreptiella gymnastica-like, Strain CCMP1594" /NCGR_SAMPLE_ID=MMETSP0811_2 /ASSEMBLY_ACC=CAM_ASM_000667 /LENGTH=64 /DNA_ID=CAMNT_0015479151 /DNA_START=1133 /DNA_END=1323 /DNA_ORIENTATION=-